MQGARPEVEPLYLFALGAMVAIVPGERMAAVLTDGGLFQIGLGDGMAPDLFDVEHPSQCDPFPALKVSMVNTFSNFPCWREQQIV